MLIGDPNRGEGKEGARRDLSAYHAREAVAELSPKVPRLTTALGHGFGAANARNLIDNPVFPLPAEVHVEKKTFMREPETRNFSRPHRRLSPARVGDVCAWGTAAEGLMAEFTEGRVEKYTVANAASMI